SIKPIFAVVVWSIESKILQNNFYSWMSISNKFLVNFWKAIINEIKQDVFMLLIAMKIIEFSQVGRQKNRFAASVILDADGIKAGWFMSTDFLWRTGSSRGIYGEFDFS